MSKNDNGITFPFGHFASLNSEPFPGRTVYLSLEGGGYMTNIPYQDLLNRPSAGLSGGNDGKGDTVTPKPKA